MSSPGVQIPFTQEDTSFPSRLHCLKCEPRPVELWIGTPIQGACKHQVWSKWLMRLSEVWQVWGWSSTWYCYPSFRALRRCQPNKAYVFSIQISIHKKINHKSWPFFMHFQHPLQKMSKPIPRATFFHYFYNSNLFYMSWLSPTPMHIIRLKSMFSLANTISRWWNST